MLSRAFMRNPELATIVATDLYQPSWVGPPLWNTNPLLYEYPDVVGVKVGYTAEAKDVIVAAAERDGRSLIVTVLGSDEIYSDTASLFDWAFDYTPQLCSDLAT
jgi:D-alanyl-D-alanine carboxypeptidase (penicillin-binding protein 5/6)